MDRIPMANNLTIIPNRQAIPISKTLITKDRHILSNICLIPNRDSITHKVINNSLDIWHHQTICINTHPLF